VTPSGIFQVLTVQSDEDLILETNHELRKCDEPIPDREGLGRWALSIPLLKWVELRRKYPDLASKDPQIRSRAYLHFMRTAESIPYRVRGTI
jgi:hypothetical protein